MATMKVVLRNPRREVEVDGPLRVRALLERLDVTREAVLVIRGDTLVTDDAVLQDDDEVEIRPVVSGGCGAGDYEPGRGEAGPPTAVTR